jgi:hypothetical protein
MLFCIFSQNQRKYKKKFSKEKKHSYFSRIILQITWCLGENSLLTFVLQERIKQAQREKPQ